MLHFSQVIEQNDKPLFKLVPFGSWFLQTDDRESDIDTILCAYQEICFQNKMIRILDHDNGTFFDKFFKHLKDQSCIQSILKIEEAQVPLIKLKINDIDIDMLLCAKKSFASELSDTADTNGKKSFNSIQGYQATKILQKVACAIPFPKYA
mgnify:CR=1 FL=1